MVDQTTPTTFSFTGNGTDFFHIWGAQMEAGASPSSYIPTVASAITRTADTASMTGTNFSSWYNIAEGSFFVDYTPASGNVAAVSIDNGGNNRLYIGLENSRIKYLVVANGTTQQSNVGASNAYTFSSGTRVVQAGAYKTNDFAITANANIVSSVASGTVPIPVQLRFSNEVGGLQINGCFRKFAYYPKRLSDAELQEMTL
jgi:hypothetical protein